MFVVTNHGALLWLETLRGAASAIWQNMGLYTNVITPTQSTVFSDLVEPTGGWYAQQAMSWGSPSFLNALGKAQCNASSWTWVSGAPDPSTTIYGVFWLDSSGALVVVDPFDVPISLGPGGVSIPYQPTMTAVEDN